MDAKWWDAIGALGEGLATSRGWASGLSRGASEIMNLADRREWEAERERARTKRQMQQNAPRKREAIGNDWKAPFAGMGPPDTAAIRELSTALRLKPDALKEKLQVIEPRLKSMLGHLPPEEALRALYKLFRAV